MHGAMTVVQLPPHATGLPRVVRTKLGTVWQGSWSGSNTSSGRSRAKRVCRGVANHSRIAECTRLSSEGECSGVS